ncbi:MAG: DNA-binding response OmpR family regulator [Spirosomataceae bacterium]
MSGNEEESTMANAFELGTDDYIAKPAGLKEVMIRTKRLLKIPLDASDVLLSGQLSTRLQKYGVGVVIPCYNESKRLKTDAFDEFIKDNPSYHIYFVIRRQYG